MTDRNGRIRLDEEVAKPGHFEVSGGDDDAELSVEGFCHPEASNAVEIELAIGDCFAYAMLSPEQAHDFAEDVHAMACEVEADD